jgi:hypothetical protein
LGSPLQLATGLDHRSAAARLSAASFTPLQAPLQPDTNPGLHDAAACLPAASFTPLQAPLQPDTHPGLHDAAARLPAASFTPLQSHDAAARLPAAVPAPGQALPPLLAAFQSSRLFHCPESVEAMADAFGASEAFHGLQVGLWLEDHGAFDATWT